MKKNLKFPLFLMLTAAFAFMFSACGDDDNNGFGIHNEEQLGAILSQYVNNTVIPTYKSLADVSLEVESACENLYNKKEAGTAVAADVQAVCDAWIKSRKYWEYSEAFLLGPATVKGIDPHIDSWPLDKASLDKLLANTSIMEDLDASYITTNYGSGGLCGFHALEYIVFENGKAKDVSKISVNEAKYAYAVSGDLMLQCVFLEAAWAGIENVSSEKQDILEEEDYTPDEDTKNWGDNFINAGKAGSRYRTQIAAVIDFIGGQKGCIGISQEVGDTKIGDPVGSGNVLDVESWYSFNSKTDFQDNIRGIRNVIMGGAEGKRDENKSIYSYLKERNETLAEELKDAIEDCIGEDGKTGIGTIIQPFRDNLEASKNKVAMEACQHLSDKLAEVTTYLREY